MFYAAVGADAQHAGLEVERMILFQGPISLFLSQISLRKNSKLLDSAQEKESRVLYKGEANKI